MSPCTSTGSTVALGKVALCSRSQTARDVRRSRVRLRPAGLASAGRACSGPARSGEPNCAGASAPTSRAKPGTGLGSCHSRLTASRNVPSASRRSVRLGRGQPAGEGPTGEPAVDGVRAPVAFAARPGSGAPRCRCRLCAQDPYSARSWLIVGSGRLVLAPVEPEHPLLVEGEHLALAAGAEQPVAAGAETRPAGPPRRRGLRSPGPPGGAAGRRPGRPGPGPAGSGSARGPPLASSWWATSVDRALGGVDVHVSQAAAGAAAGPARSGPTGSWRAARCRVSGSSSRAR